MPGGNVKRSLQGDSTPYNLILAAIHAAQQRHMLFTHLDTHVRPLSDQSPTKHRQQDFCTQSAADQTHAEPGVFDQTIVVGVSGGADSVCLLHALHALRQNWRLELHVAHLDHSLRPTSAADADWVQQLAHMLGLPFHHARLSPGELDNHPRGPEDAARQARYAFLCQTARAATPQGKTPIVAVAHHQNDQAETVLMNLLRGSGPLGLGGMLPVTEIRYPVDAPPVRLIRPLLSVSRATILAALARSGQSWREDATNIDAHYLRNRIRHTVLPTLAEINPQIHATLARNADILAGDAARLAARDRQTLHTLLLQSTPAAPRVERQTHSTAQRLVLHLDRFQKLDWATRRGVLRQAIACFPVEARAIGYQEIDSVINALVSASPAPAPAHTPAPAPEPTPGPHPLAGGLSWTHFPATREEPARLSLHQSDVLPWLPSHPHLPPATGDGPCAAQIPVPGTLSLSELLTESTAQWSLHARLLAPPELPANWRASLSPWEAYLDAGAVCTPAGELVLTTPQWGLRIAPLGMDGHTKTLGDLFTAAKIHPTLRPVWPIIQCQSHTATQVLWVCGLTLSHHARITDHTRQILHLSWRNA